ncbi:MAG TPA: hypothetical protein VD886_20375 [Herpetosiphonaceae bacterium]|nr:hypothetical protein [Herpetosiphonaceae bacterium]
MNTNPMIAAKSAGSDWEPPITGEVVLKPMLAAAAQSSGSDWEPPITG